MLGWEYPPHIAGGLGTACEGLTTALARLNVDVTFVVPRLYGGESADHMTLIEPNWSGPAAAVSASPRSELELAWREGGPALEHIRVPAMLMPYWTEQEYYAVVSGLTSGGWEAISRVIAGTSWVEMPELEPAQGSQYGSDIFDEVARYTQRVLRRMAGASEFDLVHAHDWMTYPAGVALKYALGKPLVVHVHSLEFDRSGQHVNERIHATEHYGLTHADAVIAVSHYTKSVVHREHGIPLDKIYVVHNGIYKPDASRHYKEKHPDWPAHVVLFLGRITFQKGPDYFLRAAAKVIPHVPDVLFVMAGSGDMLEPMKRLARDLGIEDHVLFPGFLRGREVEEMFNVADLYVMPSVSEPFGISALEAINFETPTLLSRQSGASEVLDNALKFDFWDVDRLADLMINGLLHEELRTDMIAMAKNELKHLRWDASAAKTVNVYNRVTGKGE